MSSRYLLVQSLQWKHQNHVYDLLKFNNKDTSIKFEQVSYIALVFALLV